MAESESEEKLLQKGSEAVFVDHVGFGQLEALGQASGSLGLISTLVFSLCISMIGDVEIENEPERMNFLSLATTFSTYTTCYSLLEFYYCQMFVGVDTYLSRSLTGSGQEEDNVQKARVDLQRKVRAVFGDLNPKRAAARNSMWLGLISLVMSAVQQLPLLVKAAGYLTASQGSCGFFIFNFAMVFSAWCKTRASDLGIYSWICGIGMLVTFAEFCFIGSDFPMNELVSLLILMSTVAVVPYTVLSFRTPLMPLVKDFSQVY